MSERVLRHILAIRNAQWIDRFIERTCLRKTFDCLIFFFLLFKIKNKKKKIKKKINKNRKKLFFFFTIQIVFFKFFFWKLNKKKKKKLILPQKSRTRILIELWRDIFLVVSSVKFLQEDKSKEIKFLQTSNSLIKPSSFTLKFPFILNV